MSKPTTTTVEIDTGLLQELRAERPGKTDRELIEDMIVLAIGDAIVRRARARSTLTEDEALQLAVQAVREVRAGR